MREYYVSIALYYIAKKNEVARMISQEYKMKESITHINDFVSKSTGNEKIENSSAG